MSKNKNKQKRESRKPKLEQFYTGENVFVQARGKLTQADRDAIERAAQVLERGLDSRHA